ncbi:hypothetical protein SNEBB_000058 [Seison nebaliae]|nr:hypothetical protein SNEBB_000058 [Seison nebaliae]
MQVKAFKLFSNHDKVSLSTKSTSPKTPPSRSSSGAFSFKSNTTELVAIWNQHTNFKPPKLTFDCNEIFYLYEDVEKFTWNEWKEYRTRRFWILVERTEKYQRRKGIIPSYYVAPRHLACQCLYLHEKLTRKDVESMLSKKPTGSFIIRTTDNSDTIVISVQQNNGIGHYRTEIKEFTSLSFVTNLKCSNRYLVTTDAVRLVKISAENNTLWQIPRRCLKIESKLEEGNFGKVFFAKWNGPMSVAIKQLKTNSIKDMNDMLGELGVMHNLEHRNVLRLYGCNVEKNPFWMVLEFCANGSLRAYLRNHPKITCKTGIHEMTFRWICDIVNGLIYLKSHHIIHRDLAARNILLDATLTAKIGDFGLTTYNYFLSNHPESNQNSDDSGSSTCSPIPEIGSLRRIRLPLKWAAPESIRDSIFSFKTDIWSFGILVKELLMSGADPYPSLNIQQYRHMILSEDYQIIYETLPINYPIPNCLAIDPGKRPEIEEVKKFFSDAIKKSEENRLKITTSHYHRQSINRSSFD